MVSVGGAEIEVVEGAEEEETGVSKNIQQPTPGGRHPATPTHPHMGPANAIGNLANQASCAWSLKPAPGNSTSNQKLKIEVLTSSRRENRKQMTTAYTAYCIVTA